jgi:hypothetical protein
MKYLIIDACLNGTGIRDYYEGGYIIPETLGLSAERIEQLNAWLLEYSSEHFRGFTDEKIIDNLDQQGVKIAVDIKNDLVDVKVGYFSDARMKTEIIVKD